MSKIEVHKNSITKLKTDAIVNAANSRLAAGGGVCGAIFAAAGKEKLEKECAKYGHCDPGDAVATSACDLPNKFIIHAVGPRFSDGMHGEPEQLYSCYLRSLELARERSCHSIGFPVISAGIYGYPKTEAWEIALKACRDYIAKNPDYELDIVFVSTDSEMADLGKKILANMSVKAAPEAEAKHYRVYIADSGKFNKPDQYEFIAEFASQKLAEYYMNYMRGKQRYQKKDIIIREVPAPVIEKTGEKSVIACSVIGEYLQPGEWDF